MKKYWLDCVFATVFVFAVLWGISGLADLKIFDALNPIAEAVEDTKLTDFAFTTLRVEPPLVDTDIVIVNIGNLPRGMIGRQIEVLNSLQPKIIALDMIFYCPFSRDSIECPNAYDTLGNKILADAIANTNIMVLGHKLAQSKTLLKEKPVTDEIDSLIHSDENIRGHAYEGFVNLATDADHQEDLKICREFVPAYEVYGKQELAFPVKIASLYDSVKTKRFLERNNEEEVINYRGNILDWHTASEYPGRYIVLDYDQVLDTTSFVTSMIKDKIVIMGFLGKDLRDPSWEDKLFTPLNKKPGGRARPDMFGVVIHANIVSMILSEDYIDVLEEWQGITIAIVLVFLNVILFAIIYDRIPLWFDTASIALQLTELISFVLLMPYVMYWFNFELEISLAMVALALAGPCFEIYISIIKAGAAYLGKKWFTKKPVEVLTE
ncbi:MAG: CHASE2 domain-containing protein [Cyclobacteriaceae bacterium]|nr:CHASE2 domain-containing protein [Cyclobacteriaceae bacterium]